MLRRVARERREYLYQKAQQQQAAATFDRKRKVREAVEGGKALPAELRGNAKEVDRLRGEIAPAILVQAQPLPQFRK